MLVVAVVVALVLVSVVLAVVAVGQAVVALVVLLMRLVVRLHLLIEGQVVVVRRVMPTLPQMLVVRVHRVLSFCAIRIHAP